MAVRNLQPRSAFCTVQAHRKFLDAFAIRHHIQKPEDWYQIQQSDISTEPGNNFIPVCNMSISNIFKSSHNVKMVANYLRNMVLSQKRCQLLTLSIIFNYGNSMPFPRDIGMVSSLLSQFIVYSCIHGKPETVFHMVI